MSKKKVLRKFTTFASSRVYSHPVRPAGLRLDAPKGACKDQAGDIREAINQPGGEHARVRSRQAHLHLIGPGTTRTGFSREAGNVIWLLEYFLSSLFLI